MEFSSQIIKVGPKRIKLQLWDTAGTERFRSVSRSYYRGAAGAILVYDIASRPSFDALPTFLNDARALASPQLTLVLVGNKADLAASESVPLPPSGVLLTGTETGTGTMPSSVSSRGSAFPNDSGGGGTGSKHSSMGYGLGSQLTATTAAEGREITPEDAARWASTSRVPVCVEVSAYTGEGVDEVFARLARMILTKIELGEIDPDDPMSGIQYGDCGAWGMGEGGSVKSGVGSGGDEGALGRRRRRRAGTGGWVGGMREWEAVFRLDGQGRRRRVGGCC